MRALTIRPDDADLFCHFATPEQYGFFRTHLSAFKRMWEAEGKVYWLRFLLCLKDTLEHTLENKPEFEFMYDIVNMEQLQSLVYINIHKKFVQSTYSVTKSFMEQVFVLAKNFSNLKEQTRMRNPFYTKETREAFRELFGKPEVDEDIPFIPVAYMASIYGFFVGSVCTLLKRWLKEPDLSEEAKIKIDYTHFYWKPHSEWSKDYYWPTCFDEYLADTYGTDLPKMLLTSNVHEVFLSHSQEDHSPCVSNRGDINIFELLRDDDEEEEETDENESFLMNQIGYLQPKVQNCVVHSNCYQKVLHDSKCSQPYLCKGSDLCKLTCDKTQKNMHTNVQPTTFWKKIACETFACKGSSDKRHVSTLAYSHNTQIETFVHITENLDSSKICKHLQETIQAELEYDFVNNPDFLNCFNQHKRKDDVKNRLRNKFNQKYCSIPEEFNDPDFRQGLFEDAQKLYVNNKLGEELNVPIFSGNQRHKKWVYAPGSVLNSIKNAETTIAVGTHSILTGRIVTSTSSKACSTSTSVCTNINPEPPIAVPNDSKSKSKKSKKKKKSNASNENKDAPALNTNPATSTNTHQNSCPQSEIPSHKPGTKENPTQLPEPQIAVRSESKSKKKKKGNAFNENKDTPTLSTNNIALPSTTTTQQNSCNQPGIKENPAQHLEPIIAVPSESKSKKKKKGNASNENKNAPLLSINNTATPSTTTQQSSLCLPYPPTHVPSTVDTHSASKDSQAFVKKVTSLVVSACDKSQEKSLPLTTEKSKDVNDAFSERSQATGDAVTAAESKSPGDAMAGGSESTGESENTRDAVVEGSEKTGDAMVGGSKSTGDIAEDSAQLCFGGCIPTFKTGHKCDKEKCSLNACCSGCTFDEKKNTPMLIDSKLGSAALITKKHETKDSKVNGTEALVINKNNKQSIEQIKSGTVDLNDTTANNPAEKPVTNEKQTVENEIPKDSMAVSYESTVNPSLDAKQAVIKEQLTDSSNNIEVDTVYQNDAEKVLEDNQCTDNSFDLKYKMIKENGVECQIENDNISAAVALEAHAAISNLKFESKDDKPVEDFLTLIGVLKDNSYAISETKECSNASLTNEKGDSDVKNKKMKFKTCAFCGKKEFTPKTFKRCAKCKAENLAVQRYYCSRECQIDDWQESHRDEHLKNLL